MTALGNAIASELNHIRQIDPSGAHENQSEVLVRIGERGETEDIPEPKERMTPMEGRPGDEPEHEIRKPGDRAGSDLVLQVYARMREGCASCMITTLP